MKTKLDLQVLIVDHDSFRRVFEVSDLSAIYYIRRAMMEVEDRRVVDRLTKAEGRQKTVEDLVVQEQQFRKNL